MSTTIVLVSGANRGIGLEIVRALLESAPTRTAPGASSAPYHVYLGSRDLQKGKDVAAGLPTAHGSTVSAIQLDILSPESVNAAAEQIKAEQGRLDVLINNAGANFSVPPDEAATMRALYDLNVVAQSRMTDTFKTLLLTQPAEGPREKRIINITSSMGSTGARMDPTYQYYSQGHKAYRCTKAALGMLTACQAFELKDDGVKVHAFDPGWVATEFGGGDPKITAKYGAVDPRVPGLACRDVVEGKRDHERDVMVSINGDTFPW